MPTNQLDQSDTALLQAAIAWLEKGNFLEAYDQLEKISPIVREHPIVLRTKWMTHSMGQDWDSCLNLARFRTERSPEEAQSWIDYASSFANLGRLNEACTVLMTGTVHCPEEAALYYDLACYYCKLEQFDEAFQWLGKSFEMPDGDEYRELAMEDPDLESIRTRIA